MNAASWLAAAFAFAVLALPQTAAAYTWGNVAIGGGGFVSAVIPSKTESGVVYARTDVGGAYRWDNTNGKWIPLTDWVSEDQTGYLGVESLAVDPKNAANVYLFVGISYFNGGKTAILRSADYGRTFATTDVTSQFMTNGNGMGRQNGERLIVDPGSSNVLYVGTRANGLFKSTNSGASWSSVTSLPVSTTPNGNGISFVIADPSSVSGGVAQRLFVGVSRYGSVGANLYRSDNAGASFTALSGSPSGSMPQRAAFDGAGNLYITYGNGAGPNGNGGSEPMSSGQIMKYNVASGAWTNVTPSGVTAAFSGITVDPTNAQRLVASSINQWAAQGSTWGDQIYISTNGGASWTNVVARGFVMNDGGVSWIDGRAIHWAGVVAFDPFNPKSVWVTSGNGIFKTSDIDAVPTTWTFTAKGLEETVPLQLYSKTNGPLLSGIGDIDGLIHYNIYSYTNPAYNPFMGTSSSGLTVADGNQNTVVRVGPKMYVSQNGGVNWTQVAMNGSYGQVALSANAGALLHAPDSSTTTYRSTNLGGSWTAVGGLSVNSARPIGDPVNSSKFYVYDPSNGRFMISTDGGASFWQFNTLATGGSNVIRAAPGIEGDIWVPLYGGGLARTTSSGWQFTTFSNVTYCGAVGFGKAATGATYPTVFIWGTVNGVRGVYRSTDAGTTWTRINDDAHQYGGPGNGHFIVGDMSTAGRGIVFGTP